MRPSGVPSATSARKTSLVAMRTTPKGPRRGAACLPLPADHGRQGDLRRAAALGDRVRHEILQPCDDEFGEVVGACAGGQPLEQFLLLDLEADGGVQRRPELVEAAAERASLRRTAGEAIEHEAVAAVGLCKPLGDDVDDDSSGTSSPPSRYRLATRPSRVP